MKKVLKFEKEDCNPCVLVSDFLTKNEIVFDKIDAYNQPEMAMKFKVRSVPTTLLLNDDEVLLKVVGYKPEELTQIKNFL